MKKNKNYNISATSQVEELWEEGYFVEGRRIGSVNGKLGEAGYNFSTAELDMALKRAPFLTRRGKKGSYEYIQKGPFKKLA